MAEPLATTPIRYSFGADEHLFAEVSDSMSLEAFSRAWPSPVPLNGWLWMACWTCAWPMPRSRSASTPTASAAGAA